jgi:glycosyltransferase involved in cell wall biosynthesis
MTALSPAPPQPQGIPASAVSSPVETDTLAVSVVVPTFRRDETLLRLLTALAAQDLPREQFEIIVVDDACSESTPAAVAAFAAREPGLRLRLLPGKSRGPATARNLGWRAAIAPLIAFIDDDAYPERADWLRQGLQAFADPQVAAAVGRVRVPADDPPTDFQRNVKRLETADFLTCNAFCRREALERVGGFDPAFRVPFREDSDLQFRIEAAGGRIARLPEAVVIHPAPPGRFAVSLRLQRYSLYNALLYKKHPRRYRAEIQRRPPLAYYGIILAAPGALAALAIGRRHGALALALVWLGLEGEFFVRRARGAAHTPRHLLDLLYTSALIPWLSVYWRLRGAWRFRVWFL